MICEATALNKYIEKSPNIFFIFGSEIVLKNQTRDQINEFLKKDGFTEKKILNEKEYSDIEKTIIDTVNELRNKFSYVFTSGGIGPTHDDITAESISKAFSMEYGSHKEAYKILEKYYDPGKFTEGRQKMACMPIDAVSYTHLTLPTSDLV